MADEQLLSPACVAQVQVPGTPDARKHDATSVWLFGAARRRRGALF
jgi:hypothetical protein